MPLPFILAGAAVAAASYGAKKGYDGYQDKSEASDIIESAKRKYDEEKTIFDEQNDQTNKSLTSLGEFQLQVGNDFKEFRTIAEKLLVKLNQSNSKDLEIDFPQHKLDEIDGLALSTTAYMSKVAGAGAAGAAVPQAIQCNLRQYAARKRRHDLCHACLHLESMGLSLSCHGAFRALLRPDCVLDILTCIIYK